jgi:hypothetical protein
MLGGKAKITSTPGKGTKVTVTLPRYDSGIAKQAGVMEAVSSSKGVSP